MTALVSGIAKQVSTPIPFSRPALSKKELVSVLNCLVEDELGFGRISQQFEREFARAFRFRHALSVNSFTAAWHLAFLGLEIGPDDEIITSSLGDLGLADAAGYLGARVVPVDIERDSFHICLDGIRQALTSRTRAVIISHPFGNVFTRWEELESILDQWEQDHGQKIFILEDFSAVLGQENGAEFTGHRGKVGVVSFAADMMITNGHGAMLVCSDPRLYGRVNQLRNLEDRAGGQVRYDYRITDFQAAMGLEQLANLGLILERRKKIGRKFLNILAKTSFTTWFNDPERDTYLNFPVITKLSWERVERYFKSLAIEVRPPVRLPLHQFMDLNRMDFPNCEKLVRKGFLIPCYPHLSKNNVERISQALRGLY